jgi:Fe-S-cluster-containing dehydrogenase component
MYFGQVDDRDSEVSRLLRERRYKTLMPETGNRPHVYYLL